MMLLTILGSATAPTVLHNLLRSHLELSLMGKDVKYIGIKDKYYKSILFL